MKYFQLPTWLLMKLNRPLLPKIHPWYEKDFTLQDWVDNSTGLCKLFDLVFWFSLFNIMLLGIKLLTFAK